MASQMNRLQATPKNSASRTSKVDKSSASSKKDAHQSLKTGDDIADKQAVRSARYGVIGVSLQPVCLHCLLRGIDDPVFRHAMQRVILKFDAAIPRLGGRGSTSTMRSGTGNFSVSGSISAAFAVPKNITCGARSNVLGSDIGFDELLRTGSITRRPRLFAVQPAHCGPIARAFLSAPPAPPRPPSLKGWPSHNPIVCPKS